MAQHTYSPTLEAQVLLEVLTGEKAPGQVAKAYGVHPNSVGLWKRRFLERAPEISRFLKTSWGRAADDRTEGGAGAYRGRPTRPSARARSARAAAVDLVLPHAARDVRAEVLAPAPAVGGDRRGTSGVRLPPGNARAARDARVSGEPEGGAAAPPAVGSARKARRAADEAEWDPLGDPGRRRAGEPVAQALHSPDRASAGPVHGFHRARLRRRSSHLPTRSAARMTTPRWSASSVASRSKTARCCCIWIARRTEGGRRGSDSIR